MSLQDFIQAEAAGFADAAGADKTADSLRKLKTDRDAASERELKFNTHSILNDIRGLQRQRATLDPVGDKDKIAKIDTQLGQMRTTFSDLYHPQKNPGNLSKLMGHLKAHLQGNPYVPPEPVATPAEARERLNKTISGYDAAGAGTAQPAINPYTTEKKQLIEAGFSPEDAEKAIRQKAGIEPKESPTKFQAQLTTTTDAEGKTHYWRVPLEAGGKPEEVDFQGQTVAPKAGSGPKVGSFGDFMTTSFGPHPTPQQYETGRAAWAKSGAGTTVGEHVVMVPQPDGSIKPITVVTTSTKSFPNAPASPNVPTTPGEAKKRATPASAPKPHGGVVNVGEAVGGKLTAPQSKAKTEYDTAIGLATKADLVAKNPNDAINQKRLAVALERLAAGRFTTQALDYVIKAGWGNTLEQWANNPSTGALPSDIMRQLVDGAHQEVADKKAALDASGYKDPASGTSADDDDKFLQNIK